MQRILQITGKMDRAGAETMVMNLYRNIDRSKFQFDFVSFSKQKGDYDEEIENLGGRIFHIQAADPIKRTRMLIKLLKQHPEWQTVHCHMLFSNVFHLYAAKKARVKNRITHSHSTGDHTKDKLAVRIYRNLSRKLQARYATNFVACSEDAGKFLFPKVKNILIIPNSIDVKDFAEAGENQKDYLRREFKLSDQTLILLQLGRLIRIKNHSFTFEILKELKKLNTDFRLFIAGQGDMEEDLRSEVKQKDLENEVVFMGMRTDVPLLLAGADLMLMPSLHEGFPVVLVESQATGTPALISDSISKEVDLGINLIHFESLKTPPVQWAEKIIALPEQPVSDFDIRLKNLTARGFDVKTNVKSLEQFYYQ